MNPAPSMLIMAGAFATVAAWASPPQPGSRDAKLLAGFEDWVRSQYTADHRYCCDAADGRPLDASEVRIVDGRYEVKWATRHWPDGNDQWLPVDPTNVLADSSPIGMHVAWIMYGHVYCLALPDLD